MTNTPTKKKIRKSWGLKTGDLVYRTVEKNDVNFSIGKIVSIWEIGSGISCDVYWFGSSANLEEGLAMSQIREITQLRR